MKPSDPPARVRFSELLDAFYFVSVDIPYEHEAYINPATGAIFYVSPDIDAEGETPDDFETSDRYIAVPHKNDFNLGRDLVFSFVDDELPEHFETVAGFFRRKGAYRRFKDFLDRLDLLDKWHAFESRATENELRTWAKAQGIEFTDERTPADRTPPMNYTAKQGQYLAFIYHYSLLNRRAPAEFDFQMYFRVSAPTVHQMIVSLDRKGFISRTPGQGRSIVLNLTKDQLPELKAVG